jgi:hypothetical protein
LTIFLERALTTAATVIRHNDAPACSGDAMKRSLQHTLVHDRDLGARSLMVMYETFLSDPAKLVHHPEYLRAMERVARMRSGTAKGMAGEITQMMTTTDDEKEMNGVDPEPLVVSCTCQLCQEWQKADAECRRFVPDNDLAKEMVRTTNNL